MTATPAVAPAAPPHSSKLYRDAASLASSSMLTAVLGIGFWAVCARYIPPAKLGVQTALLSIIVAPALVVASGVGDAFTAVVPAAGELRPQVVRRGYRLLLAMALPVAAGAAALAVTALPEVRFSLLTGLLVFAGVLIWAMFIAQDPALTSMGRAHWLPLENGSVSLGKIALLPPAIAVGVFEPVLVATLVPSVVAVSVLFPQVLRLSRRPSPRDAETGALTEAVAGFSRMVQRTTASVALSLGTLTATPFIVTAAAGPTQGAVFSLALSVVQSLDFVGAALGVSLVVHASGAGPAGGRMAMIVFKRTAAVVGAGAVVLVIIAPFVLRTLNPRYLHLHGAVIIAILAAGSFSRCLYVIWAALQRARREMRALLVFNGTAATAVLATMAPVSLRWGATGAAIVIAGANALLSSLAAGHLAWRHRRAGADPVPSGRHRVVAEAARP